MNPANIAQQIRTDLDLNNFPSTGMITTCVAFLIVILFLALGTIDYKSLFETRKIKKQAKIKK